MIYQHILFDDFAAAHCHNLCMAKVIDEIALLCGERLKECRFKAGLTQESVSKLTGWRPRQGGLGPRQIANFEQGTRRIGYEEAQLLVTVFREHASAYFLGVVDERESFLLVALRQTIPSSENSAPTKRRAASGLAKVVSAP